MADGRCACGEVRYRLNDKPFAVHCCHCRDCQRETGSAFVINGLIETLFLENCNEFAELVRTGDLDFLLLKPIDEQFLVSCRRIDWGSAPNLLMGAILMATALVQKGWVFDPVRVGAFALTFTCGAAIAYSFMLLLTSVAFSMLGFIIGIWAKGFEQLNFVPALLITPLTFLGGAFYSIDMLPQPWRTVSLFNPVVYLVSGFRWSFFGAGDVSIAWSLGFTAAFLVLCLALIVTIFRTGYRLKN